MQRQLPKSGSSSTQFGSDNRYFGDNYVNSAAARCDREIGEIESREGVPAWLATLGTEDWRCEQRLLQASRKGR